MSCGLGTKHEGHGYYLSFVLFRDEFLKYFLCYHREGDSSDQLSSTVFLFAILSDS